MSGPVDVIMPTYNQARFLAEALEGLRAQTYRNFRLTVCDDGSTDETWDVLSRADVGAPLTLTRNDRNMGAAAAINNAASLCNAPLRTWISSDNVMDPRWLESLARCMDVKDMGAVYSSWWTLQETGKKVYTRAQSYRPEALASSENCYFGPSFLMRADVWKQAGQHEGRSAHDYGHWARVEEVCWRRGLTIMHVEAALCVYRQHPEQAVRRRPELYDADFQRARTLARRAGL